MLRQSKLLVCSSGKRVFSSATDSARVKIAQGVLKLRAIRAAANEKDLAAAVNGAYPIDVNNLQPEISAFKEYLSSAPAVSKFEPNPSFWHNKPLLEMVTIEAQRAETWPFIVGGVVAVILLAGIIPSMLSEEGKKYSAYEKLKNKTYFDEEFAKHTDGHGHGHH